MAHGRVVGELHNVANKRSQVRSIIQPADDWKTFSVNLTANGYLLRIREGRESGNDSEKRG